MTSLIYLDNNATTPMLPDVVEVVARVMRDCFGNPGSPHRAGRRARQVLEESREQIALLLEAGPKELIFTSGGTEANNLALRGLTHGLTGTIALSPGEHPSSLEVCRAPAMRAWNLHKFPVDPCGQITSCEMPSDTRLAAVILAHNETGVVQDVKPLAAECRSRGVALHLDGVQSVGKIAVSFRSLDATTLSFGAHKFHGPRGVGGLLVRDGTRLTPLMRGGHQELERRPGTEPVALVAGMAKALELACSSMDERTRFVTGLRDRLQAALIEHCPPAIVNGDGTTRLPNTLNISFPGVDGEALLVALDLEGVCCSLGSTCASGSAEPAPILVAMGLTPDLYRSAVRFSLSALNTQAEIDDAARCIGKVVARLRNSK